MTTQTVFLLIIAAIAALLVALFQYIFKVKNRSKKNWFFAFLRFLTVFTILALLINPQITVNKTSIEKPDLILLADQSKSIDYLEQQENLNKTLQELKNNSELQNRFNISVYGFGENLKDSLSAKPEETQTQIYETLKNVQKIHRKPNSPIVVLTDGNQTFGSNYSFFKSKNEQPIYALPFGDTTQVDDLKIQRVNANKYAYLNNKFPIEILVNYSGEFPKTSQLRVLRGKETIFSKTISFTKEKSSQFISFEVKASKVGLHGYTASLSPFQTEKNKANNRKSFVVETIDQKTNVLLVSEIAHPDIAALKRSVESNERRKLIVKKPQQVTDISDYQLLILYQPKATFKQLYELADNSKIQLLTVTGNQTDWNFLNRLKRKYQKASLNKVQEIIPVLSESFEIFNTDKFNLKKYPPVESSFGNETLIPPYETLLYKQIANVNTKEPLLAFWKENNVSEAVLFGEGFWKWRLANYKRDTNFESFDAFFGKIIQYLSNKKQRQRLRANYETTYYSNNSIKITAEYFNKSFEFEVNGKLLLSVSDLDKEFTKKVPMVLKGTYYEADLSGLSAGNYEFTISVQGSKIATSGRFNVMDFDIEKQYFRPNIENLSALTEKNNGALFYNNQIETLIQNLKSNEQFKPIQKSKSQKIPLISWQYILAFLLILLAVEWFLRKFNGQI